VHACGAVQRPGSTVKGERVVLRDGSQASAPGRAAPGIGGHRRYRCWTCGAIDYRPPHTRPDMEAAYRPR